MMNYKGVIFDFNGTLVRDSQFHDEAWRRMAVKLRGCTLSDDEMTESVHGWTNRSAIEYLLGRPVDSRELSSLSDEKESIYIDLCKDDPSFAFAPGAESFLSHLSDEKIPMAIATSAGKGNVDFYIRYFGLRRWFRDGTIIFDDGSFPGKPDPEIYRRAARSISLHPSACVVIEDAASGILAAERAGVGKIIAVGFHLSASAPRMFISDFRELDSTTLLDCLAY
ncbi:MAG TPA: HAD family phosphatase [Spirochaetota bacterium]